MRSRISRDANTHRRQRCLRPSTLRHSQRTRTSHVDRSCSKTTPPSGRCVTAVRLLRCAGQPPSSGQVLEPATLLARAARPPRANGGAATAARRRRQGPKRAYAPRCYAQHGLPALRRVRADSRAARSPCAGTTAAGGEPLPVHQVCPCVTNTCSTHASRARTTDDKRAALRKEPAVQYHGGGDV